MSDKTLARPALPLLLRHLKLPSFVEAHAELSQRAGKEGWTFEGYLHALAEMEIEDRRVRKIERLRRRSGLPSDKRLSTLERDRLPVKVVRQLPALCDGGFVKRAENVLAFGKPGTGKSHVIAAIGHELVDRCHAVLYVPTFKLVQQLLLAKQQLTLEKELKRLDRFEVVILDDLGYVQQDREEMEVLFTFLSERYERRSVMITSNLVFSKWDRIFKDPMTTAAAIDRVVHHSIILEMTGPSFRTEHAKKKNASARRTKKAAPADT